MLAGLLAKEKEFAVGDGEQLADRIDVLERLKKWQTALSNMKEALECVYADEGLKSTEAALTSACRNPQATDVPCKQAEVAKLPDVVREVQVKREVERCRDYGLRDGNWEPLRISLSKAPPEQDAETTTGCWQFFADTTRAADVSKKSQEGLILSTMLSFIRQFPAPGEESLKEFVKAMNRVKMADDSAFALEVDGSPCACFLDLVSKEELSRKLKVVRDSRFGKVCLAMTPGSQIALACAMAH